MSSNSMKPLLLLTSFLTGVLSLQTMASTDVYLADIKMNKGKTKLANIKNVSQRMGYDNQPYFAPDGSGLYYTAMFQINGEQAQTDILLYTFGGTTKNISQTWTTSEYSPTPYQNGQRLSFIKVEEDGSQRLWSMSVVDSSQSILNTDIKPVGYHAWGKNQDLALFVLGEPMTLQTVAAANQPKGQVVANNIGRSIRYNPKLDAFSFTHGDNQMLAIHTPTNSQNQDLVPLPNGAEYYTWFDHDTVIAAKGTKIMQLSYTLYGKGWYEFGDVSEACSTRVTRLAVNQTQTRLAFVCDEE